LLYIYENKYFTLFTPFSVMCNHCSTLQTIGATLNGLMNDSLPLSTPASTLHNSPNDPSLVIKLSALVGLSNAGVQLNEYWEQLSALRVLAVSRPLTFAEECLVDQAECNIEEFAKEVQNNFDHFAGGSR
jgi:hypothetical protein